MNPVVQRSPPVDKLKLFAISSETHWMKVVLETLTSYIPDCKCLLGEWVLQGPQQKKSLLL